MKSLSTMGLLAVCLFSSGFSMASNGVCPAGKEGPSPFEKPAKESPGIVVHVSNEMDLTKEAIAADGWRFRARTIVIPPGAAIPLHSHNERPETAVMKSGEVTVYEPDCTVPYVMREGVVTQNGHGKSHWVRNESDEYSIMYVVDLVKQDSFPGTAKK